ncbi:MAG: prolyl oligopeptidase family serine peptidase [Kofleriaceae bacterium]
MTAPELNEAFLAQAAATYNFRLGQPQPLAITKDGAVLFSRTPARDFAADLFELDARTGAVRTLATVSSLLGGATEQLSEAEQARRERTRTATRGIMSAQLAGDDRTVFIPLGEQVYLLDRKSGDARALALGEGGVFDPRLSPDGAHVAFVRGGEVWTCATAPGATPQRLVERASADFELGCAEFAAQEELSRTRGLWWSPDNRALLFQRTDVRPVEIVYVADPRHPSKPPVAFRYPRAGTANAIVDLGVVSVDGGEPRWLTWDLARWPYLAAVRWPARGPLTLVVLDREQYEVALLAVDVETGQVRTLLVERDAAWVNLPAGAPAWLDDGSGFLWMTEARGAWTLELHDASGAHQRSLTAPGFGLLELVGLDGDGGALVLASDDPLELQLWRVPLDGAAPARLTSEPGVHAATASGATIVVTSALAVGGTVTQVRAAGAPARTLPAVSEAPSLVPTTELCTVEHAGVPLHVAVTRPRQLEAGRRYPVLLKVYGGPHRQFVTRARDSYLMDQWYADAGFIVVRCDGRGTPHRGREWERATLHDLISIPLDDQAAALQGVGARFPELDLDRVGVFGWSFGGYLSAMAVLQRPELFKAAVAGAPVTDWALYDTAYTERYMKLPSNNPEGYARASLLTYASALTRPLLLIHGTTDDNVHFANTLALIEALYLAGKRAEVIALSGTHMVLDPKLTLARERAHIEFFRQHLGAPR